MSNGLRVMIDGLGNVTYRTLGNHGCTKVKRLEERDLVSGSHRSNWPLVWSVCGLVEKCELRYFDLRKTTRTC